MTSVTFTQLFAWTIAASRPAILGATILLGAVLACSRPKASRFVQAKAALDGGWATQYQDRP